MARTFVKQYQISGSIEKSDTLGSSDRENQNSSLEQNLNAIRSELREILGAGHNWYDDAPFKLEEIKHHFTSSAQFLGTMDVNGAVDFDSTLDVVGAVDFNSTLDVAGAVILQSTLEVTGAVQMNGALNVDGAVDFDGALDVAGATLLQSTLDVDGAVDFDSTLDVAGAVILQSTLEVTGAVQMNGALNVDGAADFDSTLDVAGAVNLQSTLAVAGIADFASAVSASMIKIDSDTPNRLYIVGPEGEIFDEDGLTFDGSVLTVAGNISANTGSLQKMTADELDIISGSFDEIKVTGDLVGRFYRVGSNYELLDGQEIVFTGSTLNIGGYAALTSSFWGPVVINNDLMVHGTTTTINSTVLTVDDIHIELGDVVEPSNVTADGGGIILKGATNKEIIWNSSEGAWTFSENLNPKNDNSLDLGSATKQWQDLYLAGNANIGGDVDATNGVFSGTLDVDGAVDFDSTLDVAGAVILQSTLEVTGAVQMNGALNVDGAVDFDGALDVAGAVNLQSTLAVAGIADFASAVSASMIKIDSDVAQRLYIVGPEGEIYDESGLTYAGSTLTVVNGELSAVSGSFTGPLSADTAAIADISISDGAIAASAGLAISSVNHMSMSSGGDLLLEDANISLYLSAPGETALSSRYSESESIVGALNLIDTALNALGSGHQKLVLDVIANGYSASLGQNFIANSLNYEDDVNIYLNGILLHNSGVIANSMAEVPAGSDVAKYAQDGIKFAFEVKTGDVITIEKF